MNKKIFSAINVACRALSLPEPANIIDDLATNPNGAKWKDRDVEAIQGMVWHQLLGWYSVTGTAKYHTGPQSHLAEGGVESIAYAFFIDRNGRIMQCNDLSKATWSQGDKNRPGDENSQFLSVAFEGNFYVEGLNDNEAGEPNDVQMLAGLALWQACKQVWEWDVSSLYGHFDFGKPACPGDTLQSIIKAVQSNKKSYDLTCARGRQGALKELGCYSGAVDGIWGNGSARALKTFQGGNGLVPDGIWGQATETKMNQRLRGV